tara:strand:- start:1125 stop:1286 length:162 start_codon:yes stop_codon:yes gene_type:complete
MLITPCVCPVRVVRPVDIIKYTPFSVECKGFFNLIEKKLEFKIWPAGAFWYGS